MLSILYDDVIDKRDRFDWWSNRTVL